MVSEQGDGMGNSETPNRGWGGLMYGDVLLARILRGIFSALAR